MMQPNPQGQPQGQPAPAGAPSPMGAPPAGGSNILQMTPQGQAMAAMQPQQGALPKMAVGGGISSLGSMINGNVSGPAPQQQMPFQSANAVPLPFVAKDGGSNNAPMNSNYADNGATDFSVDNIQQLAKGGKVISIEAMQKELKAMKHQVSKLKDNLDTMRLALTRNSKKAK
jgi:hypothetical protein